MKFDFLMFYFLCVQIAAKEHFRNVETQKTCIITFHSFKKSYLDTYYASDTLLDPELPCEDG